MSPPIERLGKIHRKRRGLDPLNFDLATLAQASQGFSGAEIEQAVISARYTSRAVDQEVSQALLVNELMKTRPLSVVMREKLTALRQWAKGRTVNAH